MNDTTTTTKYVNVYDITRVYGGPEEGGWWYDAGEPIESHAFASLDDAYALYDELRATYPVTGARYSVLGGDDFDVRIEDEPAEAFPGYIPRYE